MSKYTLGIFILFQCTDDFCSANIEKVYKLDGSPCQYLLMHSLDILPLNRKCGNPCVEKKLLETVFIHFLPSVRDSFTEYRPKPTKSEYSFNWRQIAQLIEGR